MEPASVGDNVEIEYGEVDKDKKSAFYDFLWTVSKDVKKIGPEIYLTEGQTISVSLDVSPLGKSVAVGLIQPDGTNRYVVGQNQIDHIFRIKKTGTYKFFVQNQETTTVTVEGSYYVH